MVAIVRMRVFAYVFTHQAHPHRETRTRIHVYVRIGACMFVLLYGCMHSHLRMYACMHACVCVCIRVCVHIYTCACMNARTKETREESESEVLCLYTMPIYYTLGLTSLSGLLNPTIPATSIALESLASRRTMHSPRRETNPGIPC